MIKLTPEQLDRINAHAGSIGGVAGALAGSLPAPNATLNLGQPAQQPAGLHMPRLPSQRQVPMPRPRGTGAQPADYSSIPINMDAIPMHGKAILYANGQIQIHDKIIGMVNGKPQVVAILKSQRGADHLAAPL